MYICHDNYVSTYLYTFLSNVITKIYSYRIVATHELILIGYSNKCVKLKSKSKQQLLKNWIVA